MTQALFKKFCFNIFKSKVNVNTLSTVAEKKLLVDNICMNYVKSGFGNKPVLLLSGVLGHSIVDLKPQIENLPKLLQSHTFYALDLPGYGKSIPPNRNFDSDFYKRDAYFAFKFMKTLGISKYSILGWSDGGIVGLIIASSNSQSVERLVIWGANAYVTVKDVTVYETMSDFSKWSPRAKGPLIEHYGEEYACKTWSDWTKAIRRIYTQNQGDICKKDLEKINCPTLILHGDMDPMIDSEHIPYLMKNIKKAKLQKFSKGKHNIHLKYPEDFNRSVAYFLSDV